MKPGLTGSPLDRLDAVREDAATLAALRDDPRKLILQLDGLDPRLDPEHRLQWSPAAAVPDDAELLLLGSIDGIPRFVALESGIGAAAERSQDLWTALATMPDAEASTFAAARSLVDWHRRHRFCAQCGRPTVIIRAGWARCCESCAAQHFPRTDPVVIMLAEHDGRVLLGRQARFPPGRYSALAGFVEVGEAIEEAVARELFEEAGVMASDVRYVASQPWPFPSTLMIACIATAASAEIRLDHNELENALWCDRDGVAAALAEAPEAPFLPPPRFAIAHTLLMHWLEHA